MARRFAFIEVRADAFSAEEQAIKARLRSKETILEKAVRKFVTFSKQADPAEACASCDPCALLCKLVLGYIILSLASWKSMSWT